MSTVSASPRPASCAPEPARDADRGAIAALHVARWRESYRGILDDTVLGAPLEAEKRHSWATRPLDGRCVVLRDGPGIAGFAAVEPDRAEGVFLDNLHVRPGLKGQGLGAALMAWVADRAGRRALWLEVLAANAQARAIYAAWGGREDPVFEDVILGRMVPAHCVVWPDASVLAARLRGRARP